MKIRYDFKQQIIFFICSTIFQISTLISRHQIIYLKFNLHIIYDKFSCAFLIYQININIFSKLEAVAEPGKKLLGGKMFY